MLVLLENDLRRCVCLLLKDLAELRDELIREITVEEPTAHDDLLVDLDFNLILQVVRDQLVEFIVVLVLRCVMVVVKVLLDVLLDVQWRVLLFHELGHLRHLLLELLVFCIEILNEAVHTTDDHTKEPTSNDHVHDAKGTLLFCVGSDVTVAHSCDRRHRIIQRIYIPRQGIIILVAVLYEPAVQVLLPVVGPQEMEEAPPEMGNGQRQGQYPE